MFKSSSPHINKQWKPHLGLRIHASLMKQKFSAEEATLTIARTFINELSSVSFLKDLFKNYKGEKEAQKRKEELVNLKTGRRFPMPTYPVKNKKNYELFLKFYKAAKKELDKTDKISEKTLSIIRGHSSLGG
jgi:hypothetical protein